MSEAPIIVSSLPYLTRLERLRFKRARDLGHVGFFKLSACAQCGCDIPKNDNKKYCSHECFVRAGGVDDAAQEKDDESDW